MSMMRKQNSAKIIIRRVLMALILSIGISLIFPNSKAADAATLTKVSSLTISGIKDKVFTSKAIRQSVVIKNGKKTLTAGSDYTLTYKNNIEVGKASIDIKGKGSYTGSITKTFKIVPSKVIITSVESTQQGNAIITWEPRIEATGYQIYYSDSKNGDYKKLAGIEKNTTCTYMATELEEGKIYNFKVRAYTKINKETYTGAFSKVTSVEINKIFSAPYQLEMKQEGRRLIVKLTDHALLKEYTVDRTDTQKSRIEYYWSVNIWIGGEEYSMCLYYQTEEPGLNRILSPSEMDVYFIKFIYEEERRVGVKNDEFEFPTLSIVDKTIIWTFERLKVIDISKASKFVVRTSDVTRTNSYYEMEYLPLEVLQ